MVLTSGNSPTQSVVDDGTNFLKYWAKRQSGELLRVGTTPSAADDRSIVIHDGDILDQGNHESLLAENGQYMSLSRLQVNGHR
jgi:hypothetical protein